MNALYAFCDARRGRLLPLETFLGSAQSAADSRTIAAFRRCQCDGHSRHARNFATFRRIRPSRAFSLLDAGSGGQPSFIEFAFAAENPVRILSRQDCRKWCALMHPRSKIDILNEATGRSLRLGGSIYSCSLGKSRNCGDAHQGSGVRGNSFVRNQSLHNDPCGFGDMLGPYSIPNSRQCSPDTCAEAGSQGAQSWAQL
jgi:hypothetical protein